MHGFREQMKPLLITIMGELLLRRLASSFSLLLFPLLFELNETEWWKRAKASRLQQQQQQPTVSQLFTERGVPGCGESGVRELKAGVLPFRCTDLWQSWLGDTVSQWLCLHGHFPRTCPRALHSRIHSHCNPSIHVVFLLSARVLIIIDLGSTSHAQWAWPSRHFP